jgi:hypothetical protein
VKGGDGRVNDWFSASEEAGCEMFICNFDEFVLDKGAESRSSCRMVIARAGNEYEPMRGKRHCRRLMARIL